MSAGAANARERLTAKVHAFVRTAPAGFAACGAERRMRWGLDRDTAAAWEAAFDALALDLFALQSQQVPVYAAFVARSGQARAAASAAPVPALPLAAFKRTRVAAFPAAAARVTFQTSGTTGSRPGILELEDPSLYALALERGFQHHVVPDCEAMRMLVVAPSAAEAPHSSLSFMFDHVRRRFGTLDSGIYWRDGEVQFAALQDALRDACARRQPVCLLGTAFTWVHVADRCREAGFAVRLPAGSRLFETGGYKGRSRTLTRGDLSALIESCFGIPSQHVVGEYGMTEMASQYYTTSLRASLLASPLDPVWSHPAWLRPRILDAESGRALELDAAREAGLLAHHDLANAGSVAHLLTADLGRPDNGSFELVGRSRGAEPRGCGLASEMLGARP